MEFKELIETVKNDAKQGAYDTEEILLLCEKAKQMMDNMQEIQEISDGFYSEGETVKKLPKQFASIAGEIQIIHKLSSQKSSM